jgi:hypothetical protein
MLKNLLLSPDGADSGGVDTGTAVAGGAGGESGEQLFEGAGAECGEGKMGDGEGGEGAAAAEVKATGLSKEDIAAILKEAGVGERPAAVAATERAAPPTADELEKMFNVWKPDAALLTQLRSEKPEDALAALTLIRDGLLKQAMTMAEYRVQQLLKGLTDEHITPLHEFVTEAQATSFRNDFFEKYPDLEKYEALVDAVAAKLQASGFKGDSREAVMKKFSDETQLVVKQLLAAGGGGSAAAAGGEDGAGVGKGAGTGASQRRMSTLTGGGQGGGGGHAGGKDAKGPPGIEVFD